ncbi:thioesterase II family protein [Amycolatopsis pittospori]|uniref:thioesterase II family protein n=1 Tax=Amycolatopsis pittospori TaxID=2749434 RepID=UPI0015F06235|nr:alpha/beta fold hydrolase [Amycolatopsis pittospori]
MTGNDGDNGLWVRRFHPSDNAPYQVVCFPHAGGSASYFFPVSKALTGTADVLAIQYPGRQDRRTEKGIDSITELADAVTGALRPWLTRPTVLFGHSMGASLGYEVARRLEQEGTVPLALFVSGRVAPCRARDETVHLRDDAGLIDAVKALSGTDPQIFGDEELLRMVLPALRTDYTAAETYRYEAGPLLKAPIHAHLGDSDPKASIDEVSDWEKHTNGEFTLRTYPGGHFYLNTHAPKVIEAIAKVVTPA